jgi:hypothetical protein
MSHVFILFVLSLFLYGNDSSDYTNIIKEELHKKQTINNDHVLCDNKIKKYSYNIKHDKKHNHITRKQNLNKVIRYKCDENYKNKKLNDLKKYYTTKFKNCNVKPFVFIYNNKNRCKVVEHTYIILINDYFSDENERLFYEKNSLKTIGDYIDFNDEYIFNKYTGNHI